MRRSPHFEITEATHEGDSDVATAHSFERAEARHARAIDAAWLATKHHVSLVGDWHMERLEQPMSARTCRKATRQSLIDLPP